MLELKALLLTQGMHGMVSQVEGLAKALGLSYKHQKIALKPFWNLVPPKFSPISENLVKNKFLKIYGNSYSTKDGTCERDFIHIDDVTRSLDLMIKKQIDKPINICSGKKINLISLTKKLNLKI